ncbi:MAG TPA: M28 family peptidase [Solirubrobacteraceae bacterium]|jgi:hypothetical protein|nr:M28 family peptidase [Solirubrobacteraceae bacterium]
MDPLEVATRLASVPRRAAGSDSERRVARWLRDELRASGRDATLETVWVRPDWALVHLLHCALATGGSVLSVWEPAAGLGVLGLVLVSQVGDLTARFHLVRLITPRRATQNVVSPPRRTSPGTVRLTVVAATDAGRTGAIYGRWAGLEASLRRALRGHLPSPLGALAAAVLALCGVALARLEGAGGAAVGAVQFIPTVALMLGFAALVDIALSDFSPGANVHASAVGVALALVEALDRDAPRRLDVELVLAGAGEGPALGMRAFVRSRRNRRAEESAVLAIDPCGAGTPRWLTRDGQLLALRYHPRLIELCQRAARADAALGARSYASHGAAQSFPARVARWPAIAIGCRDERDQVPAAHQPGDLPDHLDPESMDAALELCLALVGRLDDDLEQRQATQEK